MSGITNRQKGYAFLALALGLFIPSAQAGSFDFWGIDAKYTLVGNYSLAMRLEDPSPGVIDTPGRPSVPIPEEFKYPESNNFDDGNRNFAKHDIVNNRLTFLGDIEFSWRDYGLLLRGDAFYDDVYQVGEINANTSPDTLNTTQQPHNTFTKAAERFSGKRARVLDAYVYGNFYFGDTMALQLRVGQHIAAWGQSLFFSGVALAQSPADATKATIPGADVKSILLPVNQVSARFTLTDSITLLGQYKLEYQPTELNPTGEFFSVSDVVGPGAEFAYGIKNPLFLDTLSEFDIISNDLVEILELVDLLLLNDSLDIPDLLPPELALLNLPQLGLNPLNSSEDINVPRGDDILPDDEGQWGLGIEYALNFTTTVGYYYLRYHSTTPAPVFTYGGAPIADPLPGIVDPLTTSLLGVKVPIQYNVKYFDDIELQAISMTTNLFGMNVGGELIYRDGVDVLVDVDNGINGPVPTPTRAETAQLLLNAIYTSGPRYFWDALTIVTEIGYQEVISVEPQESIEGPRQGEFFDDLSFDAEESYAIAMLAFIDKQAIFSGWDMRIPLSYQNQIKGRSAIAGGFGSLFGEDDVRVGVGVEFTRLQKLTLGLNYNVYTGGDAHFLDRPLQDRDTVSFSAKYNFF